MKGSGVKTFYKTFYDQIGGQLLVVDIPRQNGKTMMVHQLITDCAPQKLSFAVVHTCQRTKILFERQGYIENVSHFTSIDYTMPVVDILIVDNIDPTVDTTRLRDLCTRIKNTNNGTVFIFGSQITDEIMSMADQTFTLNE